MSEVEATSPGWDSTPGTSKRPRRQAKQPARYTAAAAAEEEEAASSSPEPEASSSASSRRPRSSATRVARLRTTHLAVPRSASASPVSAYTDSGRSQSHSGPVRNTPNSHSNHHRANRGRSASPIVPDLEMFLGSSSNVGGGGGGGGGQASPLQYSESVGSDGGFGAHDGYSAGSPGDYGTGNNLIEQLLPGHKIARGRGRRKQLEKMSPAEKQAEKEARMEKMRISARECRLRKKHNIATLEGKLEAYEVKDKRSRNMIARLKDEVQRLQGSLRALGHEPKVLPKVARSAATPAALSGNSDSDGRSSDPERIRNRYESQGGGVKSRRQANNSPHQQHQRQQHAHRQQSIKQEEAEQQQLQYHVEQHRMQQQQRMQVEQQQQARNEPMTYNTVHQPITSIGTLGKVIKPEPSSFDQGGATFQMTGARRNSLVVDTGTSIVDQVGSGRRVSISGNGGGTTSDLQLFLQQSGAGNMTPITPRMSLDTLLVPGFQLPSSPAVNASSTYNSFNFGEVDQMLLG